MELRIIVPASLMRCAPVAFPPACREDRLNNRRLLGFVGKHTNVISRKLGNWIFLAELLTTLELEPDAPERNRRGVGECRG
jgi:hypothetical protein